MGRWQKYSDGDKAMLMWHDNIRQGRYRLPQG